MNWFEKALDILSFKIETRPTSYGWLHLLFTAIVIGITVFLCIRYKNCSDKKFRIIIGICWAVMFLFEVYKQLQYSCHTDGASASWEYQWYAFPFQFCSTPLYALPFVIFLPEGKIRNCFISYTALFALFAGITVFIYPEGIFTKELLISIQSLTHHGIQIITGVFAAVWCRQNYKAKFWTNEFYLGGLAVFALMSAIAMTLNLTIQPAVEPDTFNMFYISPYRNSSLPVLSSIQPAVPYPVFLCIYLFGFGLSGLIVYFSQYGFIKLAEFLSNRKKAE